MPCSLRTLATAPRATPAPLGLGGRSSALVNGKARALLTDPLMQNAVFFFEIVDDVQLVQTDPTCKDPE